MSFIKKINNRKYPYIIAEIGINHNGDFQLAKDMIIEAKKSGADCVKFQTFITEKYIAPYSVKASYQNKAKDFKNFSQKQIIMREAVRTHNERGYLALLQIFFAPPNSNFRRLESQLLSPTACSLIALNLI